MIQAIVIGGEPGTGKSSLVRHLVEVLIRAWKPETEAEQFHADQTGAQRAYYIFTYKKLTGLVFASQRVTVLGKYDNGEKFPGTDRLSMAVQPDAEEYFYAMRKRHEKDGWTIVLEGDRLCTASFLEKLKKGGIDPILILLEVSREERQRRYAQRGSDQKDTFLKGRETKYANLRGIYPECEVWQNETPEELSANHSKLIQKVIEPMIV